MIARSYLYVPGNAPDKLAKALSRGADAIIVDFEDAVPAAGKESARAVVREWLATLSDVDTDIWVRVNPGSLGHRDVREVFAPGGAGTAAVTGVMAAKTESPDDLAALDGVLTGCETTTGLAPGRVRVVPLLESATAVLRATQIAQMPRVERIQLGEADLAADLGVTPGPDGQELEHVRSQIVLVSPAAGINPPVGPVSTNFRDLDALRSETRALYRRGFLGRGCIHPAQVTVVNDVFTPSPDELEQARDLVARFDAAVAGGSGVVLSSDGRMVDEAVVRRARRVLELART